MRCNAASGGACRTDYAVARQHDEYRAVFLLRDTVYPKGIVSCETLQCTVKRLEREPIRAWNRGMTCEIGRGEGYNSQVQGKHKHKKR